MNASCFNCLHWKSIYPEKQSTKHKVLWEGVEPDWNEKSCEILGIDRRWTDKSAIGALINKYQSGSADEVREAITAQCPEYKKAIEKLEKLEF